MLNCFGSMLAGSDELIGHADERMQALLHLAAIGPHPPLAALCDRLASVMRGIASRSTFGVLRRHNMAPERVQWFGYRLPELWSSQVEAIDAGLLGPEGSFVLSLPTGSGKTFLAQLAIISALDSDPAAWVAYLAPSRALVREVHRKLGDALRPHGVRVRKVMASAEVAVFVNDDELPVVTGARTCVVLTPERLDLYLRANSEIADRLSLVIVDEAHLLSDGDRGAREEALLALLLTKWPYVRLHLLSAFLPNTTELKTWLGERAHEYRSTIRPTRQLRGVCMRYAETAEPEQVEVRIGNERLRAPAAIPGGRVIRRFINRRAYQVGGLLASDPSDLQGPQTVALPGLGVGENWTEVRVDGRRINGNTGPTDIAAQVTATLASHPGMVLLFLPQTAWTQSVSRQVAATLPVRDALEPYARAAAASLGNDHPLVYSLQRGCAFHNSRLPDEVLRVVEAAADASLLEVLCATSGLQAGVNLPASIVVILGDPRPGVLPNPSVRDFANMAGRAGRPHHDTEGLTLYIPPTITHRNVLALTTRRYLLTEDAEDA
jgi:replicative superfamily II helicase